MAVDVESTITDPVLRSVLDAAALARDQCLEIVDLLDKNAQESSNDSKEDMQLELSKHQKQLHARLSEIRSLNHDAMMGIRQTKATTADAKGDIDRLHLDLQNLYYEQSHLAGEIEASEGYEHPYRQLPLIPVEEFLAQHPEHAEDDQDALMTARINHEYSERQTLEERRQGLLKKKQSLIAENNKRKEDLANLDKDLEKFIEAAQPIQKIFEKEY